MIQAFIEAWRDNKHQFRLWLENDVDAGEIEYTDIVKGIFEVVINPSIQRDYDKYDIEKMTVVDDGDYQGTQIYLIPKDTYQPNDTEYIVTSNYYGSCGGCDALMHCQWLEREEMIDGIMTIALHLVERMKPLYEEMYED